MSLVFIFLNISTCLTGSRILLAPFVMNAIYQGLWMRACVLFLCAAATDFFDGYCARLYQQETEFGKLLDPVADKVLLFSTLWALYRKIGVKIIPTWFISFFFLKDFILLVGGCFLIAYRKCRVLSPSLLAKVVTALFMIFAVYVMLGEYFGFSVYVHYWIYFFTVSTCIILYDYAYKFMQLLKA